MWNNETNVTPFFNILSNVFHDNVVVMDTNFGKRFNLFVFKRVTLLEKISFLP